MKPALFDYVAPETVEAAVAALAGDETARPLAGGQSLIPTMNFRLSAPGRLVDLRRIEALRGIAVADGTIRVGAMTRHRELETHEGANRANPLIGEVLDNVAHIAIRNRGTVGGSIAHADSAAELPCLLVATGGTVSVQGPDGSREIGADDLFRFHMTTSLAQTEILTEVRIPALPPGTGYAFEEFARRRGDYALAGVCTLLTVEDGRCGEARIAACGIGARPVRLAAAEDALRGRAVDDAARADAGEAAREYMTAPADMQAGVAYRTDLLAALVRRTVATAARRAGG
ncbi:MAG: xanthine dehydrogenase family protein subunit M [Defluviicoccus sp.]|nr:xanthine dehydrogenase family protein subunit M [Defluviicoccus sp.]MDE0274408.1 xanthine dehydrogenase family protein subunit M [Defluviicoccus sp.]